MTAHVVSNETIAATSSKGNQEKWYDSGTDRWFKLDQFGYEALVETLISHLLVKSNIESDTPFTFVRYDMERFDVRGRTRTGCASNNFLLPGQSLITVDRLLTSHLGVPLREKLLRLTSDKKRIVYMAQAMAEFTGLEGFPHYLTLLFEVDSMFCNDDRHLNNIAVIEQAGEYSYCPIFDNGAGLLSNTHVSRMDAEPKALIAMLRARPFNTSFTRQMNAARSVFGKQLKMPRLSTGEIRDSLEPLLDCYAMRDRGIIADRVVDCILARQAVFTKS